MPLYLNIPDTEIPLWKKVYIERYKGLSDQIDALQDQLQQMRPILIQLGIVEDVPQALPFHEPVDLNGYNPSWKWLQKIDYILTKFDKPMTSTEIIHQILIREPNETKERLTNSIPATLYTALNSPTNFIKRQKNDKGEYEYWVDNDLF